MTKQEFLGLQSEISSSGKTIKSVLTGHGVSYQVYNYWRKRFSPESERLPMAPISISEPAPESLTGVFTEVSTSGVVLAFPNGLRAHFGHGSEPVLLELFNKSLGHVLP